MQVHHLLHLKSTTGYVKSQQGPLGNIFVTSRYSSVPEKHNLFRHLHHGDNETFSTSDKFS